MTCWWHAAVNDYAQLLHPKVRPVTHQIHNARIISMTLDPAYTPPWPGAGIIRVTPLCPRCGSHDTTLEGAVEADQAILGTDEHIWSCDNCHTE